MRQCWQYLGLVVLVAACACSSSKDDNAFSKDKGTSSPAAPKLTGDWSKRATKPVNDVVDGIKFTVSLPDRLSREVKQADDTFPGYVTWQHKGNFFDMPGFTAQIDGMPPSDLESAARELKGLRNDRTIHLKQKLADGYLVASHEKANAFLHVKIWRKHSSGKLVGFSIMQRNSEGIPNFDAQRGWMLNVARSFKVH